MRAATSMPICAEITQDEFSVEIDYFVNCFYKRDGDSLYLVGGDNR